MLGNRRVVVTGLGAVTSLGNTVAQSWEHALKGVSGASYIQDFDTAEFSTKFAALVKDFDSTLALDAKEVRRLDVFLHYGVEAARQAIGDSGLTISEQNAHRVGVVVGSGIGGIQKIENTSLILAAHSPRKVSPFFIPGAIINMASGLISQRFNCQGPNLSMVSACASGAHSIGYAARTIVYGDADVILAGGTEKASCPVGIAGFNAARALSTRNASPELASRPWDRDRDGFVLGDGAGVLVLEEYEHAKARGAKIYAELIGFGMSGDAYHMTAAEPSGRGMKSCMQAALKDAEINAQEIDYVNAHGTSTSLADPIEHAAVKAVMGDHAFEIAMSSTKSMTGHLLGAAGAVEAIFSVLSIRDGVAPPTINLDNPAPGCDLNLVPHQPQQRSIRTVLTNSFGFGGTNASLVFAAV